MGIIVILWKFAAVVGATSTVVNLRVVFVSPGGTSGRTVIHEVIPIADTSLSVLEFLREEVVRADKMLRYSDDDVKSAKSLQKRRSIHRLLSFPISVSLDALLDETPKGFEIVIEPPVVMNPSKNPPSAFDLLIEASRVDSSSFESKFTIDEVNDFLTLYDNTPSIPYGNGCHACS